MKNIELLEKLCLATGVSGEEDAVRDIILEEIKPYVASVEVTPLGNVIALRRGRQRAAKKLMLCAHMDEVGFVISNITSEGFLKFGTIGGVRPEVLSGRSVLVNGKTPGVICAKPVHLMGGDEREKAVPVDQLAIDIGASTREEAEEHVHIGDNACFVPFFEAARGTVKAKALDDRSGCFVLLELIKEEPEYDTYFVFSVQEEIGMRGAGTAAYIVEPDAAIVIEGTTAGDIAGVGPLDTVCKMGKGTAVSFMDRSTLYDRHFFKRALELGKAYDIPCQPKTASAGSNDAGVIHTAKNGARTLTLSVPCRYIHGPVAMTAESDLEATIRLTGKLMEEIAGGKL